MRTVPAVAAVKLRFVKPSSSADSFLMLLTAPVEARVQLVIEQLHLNLCATPTLPALAAWAGLCPRQLERLFRATTGYSPLQYLKQARLQKAHELISTSSLSLKAIRLEVGIPDAANFNHDFKAAFGVSPRQWQRASWHKQQVEKISHVVFHQ